ncbi:BQ2448_3855 [Microbotryum intermedium]|uniref:BQ2448_3855 protein n=1 Tax=Microbotryum intermedium TaxID=269621 RepID=A0A238FMA3_9BASI|nr:BQ2448_3855 [Microbotryum intermedium]
MRTSFLILASTLVSTVLAAGPLSLSPTAQDKCTRLAKYCLNCPTDCSKHWRQNAYNRTCQATECWAPEPSQGVGWCFSATEALKCLATCKTNDM